VFIDVDSDVHARNEVEVIEDIKVVEADLDRYDLCDLLEVAGDPGIGIASTLMSTSRPMDRLDVGVVDASG
jgi:hypothetical protein